MARGFLCSVLSLLWIFAPQAFADEGGPPTLAIGAGVRQTFAYLELMARPIV